MTTGATSVNNTTNPSAVSTNSIDVASIVSQLMTVANQPLVALQTKLQTDNVQISDLGTLSSKISQLQTDLTTLESPLSYQNVTAVSNNPSVVSVSATNGTPVGRYSLTVSQTAEASNISVGGFSSLTEKLTNTTTPFKLTIGDTTYDSSVPINNPNGGQISPLTSNSTLTDLNNWINSISTNLGANISSNIVNTSSNSYALVINGTQTGVANVISFTGLDGGSVLTSSTSSSTSSTASYHVDTDSKDVDNSHPITVNTDATDAVFSLNGLSVQRSTNTISDVINGLTFNLLSQVKPTDSATSLEISVEQGVDNSSTFINNFINSYNSVINQYQSMTANGVNSPASTPNGSFASDPGMLSFVESIKQMVAGGALTSNGTSFSLASLGMDFQGDGTLKFNSTELNNSNTNGLTINGQEVSLASILAKGINVGGKVGLTSNLDTALAAITDPGGTISSSQNIQKSDVLNVNSKISSLSNQLNELQASYTQQYSNLNTLLYNLSQTSSQLTSSLAAITNINAGK